jgi:hypothetical protein
MTPDIAPFGSKNAVEDGVARGTVLSLTVVTKDPVPSGTECLDSALGPDVEEVRLQADNTAAQAIEGVGQQEELAGRVDVCPVPSRSVPGIAYLDASYRRHDVVEARTAD